MAVAAAAVPRPDAVPKLCGEILHREGRPSDVVPTVIVGQIEALLPIGRHDGRHAVEDGEVP